LAEFDLQRSNNLERNDEGAKSMIHFLVHDSADTVGVAVVDIAAGAQLTGRDLSTNKPLKAKSAQKIPLGHKLALKTSPWATQ
jgi:hypothetical protein